MKPDEFKSLVETISKVVDARAKTAEIVIKAHVSAEIHASEERLRAEIKASEERTQAEILAARAEAKVDTLQLAGKVDKMSRSYERRLGSLEEKTDSPNPEKH